MQDTATILDNLLSDENQDNWKQLEMVMDYIHFHRL